LLFVIFGGQYAVIFVIFGVQNATGIIEFRSKTIKLIFGCCASELNKKFCKIFTSKLKLPSTEHNNYAYSIGYCN